MNRYGPIELQAEAVDIHRTRHWLALWASVTPFALIPLTAALRAYLPFLPPPAPSMVVVAVLTGAIVSGLLFALVCAAGVEFRVAASAVAAGLFVFGQYPAVQSLIPPELHSTLPAVAWLWIITAAAVAAAVIYRRPGANAALHRIINSSSIVLTLFLVFHVVRGYAPSTTAERPPSDALAVTASPTAKRPDIYHIVVDGFGHPDAIRSMYGVDVSRELEELRRAGFTISPSYTFANYAQTYLSLASILNAEYLQNLVTLDATSPSRSVMKDLIQGSRVVQSLKNLGYTFELLSGPYSATDAHDLADVCECSRPLVGEFESSLIRLTPLGDIGLAGVDYVPHRRKLLRTLDALERLTPSDQPRLVLAHLMAPHPPFVVDAHGNAVDPPRAFTLGDGTYFAGSAREYRSGYRAQATFIASRLPRIAAHLEALSASRGRAAVIIIHGDHGPRLLFDAHDASRTSGAEALPVLLAIRWPETGSAPAVTSLVNIYRTIFRRYFVPGLEQLPDHAYLSSFARPYEFVEVDLVTMKPR